MPRQMLSERDEGLGLELSRASTIKNGVSGHVCQPTWSDLQSEEHATDKVWAYYRSLKASYHKIILCAALLLYCVALEVEKVSGER